MIRLPADVSDDGEVGDVRQVLGAGGRAPALGQDIPVEGYGFRWLRLAGEAALL